MVYDIACFLGFVGVMQYPPKFQNICYGTQRSYERGNACELNSYEHEQYPFDSLNQNNRAHGVNRLPQTRYYFPSRFWYSYATPLGFNKYVMELKGFLIYPNRGIACALNNYGHK
jgi:hypothetical protein